MKIWSWHDVLSSLSGFLGAVEIKTVGLSMLCYWRFLLEGNAKYESVCLEHSQLEFLIYKLLSTHLSGPVSCTQLTGPSFVQRIKLHLWYVFFCLKHPYHSLHLVIFVLQFSSVPQSCPTLWDPMNRSTPGLPVHHKLPEYTQTHAHRVGDAIQPSHLCHPLLLLPPIPPSIRVFSSESALRMRWPKYWEFQLQHKSFQWTPRTYLLQDGLVGSPCSPRDPQESSPTPQFKSTNFSVLSFLRSPTVTSIHDHWKNHSLD